MVLGGAYVLIAFHPFMVATHYRLWRRKEKSGTYSNGARSPYANREELMISLFSILVATAVATCLRMRVGI